MGTGYKGGALEYHALKDNADTLKANFQFNVETGYFGVRGKSGSRTRNIASEDPLQTATSFYDLAAYGGIESPLKNGKGFTTEMRDGTHITFRQTSTSDGTPVVELIIVSSDTGGIKQQKIHFTKEKTP